MSIAVVIPLALALSTGAATSGWSASPAVSVPADATKYVVQVEGMT